ncbi:cysteine desulfurase family protein [Chthonomonas calidirosea]|uniref:cysteine desulfurase family protein n=1 Tax=Chthonomonas calidirosea TaxID=454171 RepID=UPI0006DD4CE1|nr:cysteine desulfurase family protein [Chthonomonas calidirosea]CEK12738.1 cysteine desulfurase family protein [Chthonomonas calidirosea]
MGTKEIIYLDHAATTPIEPEVLEAMLPWLQEGFGNPSSIHRLGREARAALDSARDSVAALIGADYSEIYFTSSGTEADNLAIIGTMLAAPPTKNHLVVSAIEHHAVLHSAHFLEMLGYQVTVVPVNSDGQVEPQAVAEAITDSTTLVSIMHANNEIGTIQPIAEIAAIAHERGALFHTDAVQTAGLLPIHVHELNCDLLSLSAHKLYGPKGAGALYIRQGLKVSPILHGGAQEREKRAGTENVAALVGFGKAAELARTRRPKDAVTIAALRDRLQQKLLEGCSELRINGHLSHRLPSILNVSVEGIEGATLLMNLDRLGIAVSSGAACSSGSIEPSHVLLALGLPPSLAASGIRFSIGRHNTFDEIDRAAEAYLSIVHRLRRN